MPGLTCVSEEQLRAFLLGELPEPVGRAVAAHLEGCPDCEAAARRLDALTDAVIDRLRQALDPAASGAVTRTLEQTAEDGTPPPPTATLLPRRVAGYEVLEEVGRGGMSVVYRARQAQPARPVALKVLLVGGHADAERRARLLAEADALARLRHPHIVQIHEVGEHDGLPFLALEYVEGGSLARRLGGAPLPPRPAAALLEPLARAVHYAHGKGIVHRDLKPANVLLAEDGTPKVTDFGLARNLDAAGLTASGAILGTPSYMAPEQAGGKSREVGPAADVYALGAILYECLTGRPPFKAATVLDTMAQVLAEEPVPPGRLNRQVPRDLETVCLKCLQKEPARRYASAQELAEDLGRWLRGEPVRARPVGPWRRAAKWARRRPALAAALAVSAAAVAALLLVGTSLTLKLRQERDRAADQAREAATQRQRAEANQERALAAIDRFLTRVGETRLASVPGVEDVRRDLLEDALRFHEEFLRDPDNSGPAARRDVARALHRLARVHRLLGQHAQEEAAYGRALALERQLVADFPADPEYRADLARTCHNLSLAYRTRGSRFAQADEALAEALRLQEELVRQCPDVAAYRADLGRSLHSRGQLSRQLDRFDEAEAAYLRAARVLDALVREHPEPAHQATQANVQNSLGALYFLTNRPALAEAALARARDIYAAMVESEPKVRAHREGLALTCRNLAAAEVALGRDALAGQAYEKALALDEQLAADHPALTYYSSGLVLTLQNYGLFHHERGRYEQARLLLERARALQKALADKHPGDNGSRYVLANINVNLGTAAYGLGRWDEAVARSHEALDLLEPLARKQPVSFELAEILGTAATALGMGMRMQGQPAEALPWLDRAVRVLQEARQRDPRYGKIRENLGEALWARGDVYAGLGKTDEALADWEGAAALDPKGAAHARRAGDLVQALRRAVRGDHAGAAALAARCRGKGAEDFDGNFVRPLAWAYVLAAGAAATDRGHPTAERARLGEAYSAQAVQVLAEATRWKHFHSAEHRQLLRSDPRLAPLRQRDDFKQLLNE